jgi:hypothetical protein
MKKFSALTLLLVSLLGFHLVTSPSANAGILVFVMGQNSGDTGMAVSGLSSFVTGTAALIISAPTVDRAGSPVLAVLGVTLAVLDIDGSPSSDILVERLATLFPFIDNQEDLQALAAEVKARTTNVRENNPILVSLEEKTVDSLLPGTTEENRRLVKHYLR